ncbi:Wzz/FepE/Etk N-terminal domain-containing protein [Paenibacillus sp. Marseille-Q4541]|uniref:YveK family protein n=1 Tax=Paenibacillus sp. Marseille-Q4541 TaxID=2831522 RepID=UPI001BA9781C|nr:Wzz/FepE/Etk N-terminal domain-containing protein [Paenibacillus sp. Marseille-Q4541]
MELKEYMNIIRKRLWLIAAIVIVACLGAGLKTYMTTPLYNAEAKLIVNQTYDRQGTAMLDYTLIQTNIMVINSYTEVIKSSAILDKVVASYPDLGLTSQQLASMISVSSANDSQVMNLTVQDTSYEQAAKTVNAVAKIFEAQIPSIMKVDNVTTLSQAPLEENAAPINVNPVMSILISFVIGLMLAVGLVFLLEYLDDTFKSEAELERELGIPVIAVIARIRKEDVKSSHSVTTSQQQVGESSYATVNH